MHSHILPSASLVIRVMDVREVSYPDSSSSDSLDDLDIFNHPPVARRQNRDRGSRAAAVRASSASRARAGRGSSGAARASTTASTGSTSSRAGGVSIDSASSARTSSGTPYSTSNGTRQDSSAMLSGTAAASSMTSSNGARQSSATLSSTTAAASSSWTSASGGAAVSSAMSSRGTGISHQLQMLGGFVWDTPERTGICDSVHATAIIGILQLTASHPQGYLGSIGTNGCTAWFAENSPVLFQHYGPLACFNSVSNLILMRHFSTAQRQARELFNQRHSSDQSGTGKEPLRGTTFFPVSWADRLLSGIIRELALFSCRLRPEAAIGR